MKEYLDIIYKYYPKDIALNDPELLGNKLFEKLISKCLAANKNQSQWIRFIKDLKSNLDIEITEFNRLPEFNPSFIAVFLVEEYERPKPGDYEPFQLVVKVSVIAPVYILYFDNLASGYNNRLIRDNPITEKEIFIFNSVRENLLKTYPGYGHFDLSMAFCMVPQLANISTINKRKPFLDECIFGLYLSIHPHNINKDKFDKTYL